MLGIFVIDNGQNNIKHFYFKRQYFQQLSTHQHPPTPVDKEKTGRRLSANYKDAMHVFFRSELFTSYI